MMFSKYRLDKLCFYNQPGFASIIWFAIVSLLTEHFCNEVHCRTRQVVFELFKNSFDLKAKQGPCYILLFFLNYLFYNFF